MPYLRRKEIFTCDSTLEGREMTATPAIDDMTRIPDLLRDRPGARPILDRYGLRGCGGPTGPAESLGFFARAHGVPVERLLSELRAAPGSVSPTVVAAQPADVIYRRFFLAGIAVVLTLGASWGAWLLGRMAWSGTFRAAGLHEINAHGHAQIFGWVGLFVMGFAYQAFPRFKHTDLRWPVLAFASWWLMLGGLVTRAVLEPFAALHPTWVGVILLAGAAEIVAVALFVGVLVGTWHRSGKPLAPYDWYIVSALGWFFIQAVCDTVYLAATLLTVGPEKLNVVATWQAPLRDLQIHGFALLMILGVSQRLLHHVYGLPAANARASLWALPVLNLAVLGEASGLILMRMAGPAWAALWYGSVVVLTATVAGLVVQWRVFSAAAEPDRSLKFIRAAYIWLLISLAMLVFLPVYQRIVLPTFAPDRAAAAGFSHAFYGATRHAITVGFISLMIVGVAARVVPTLNGIDSAILPALWLPFVLIDLGCSLRVAGQVATDFSDTVFPLVGISGVLEVTGLAVWGVHLARIMTGRYARRAGHNRTPLDPNSRIEERHIVGEVLDCHPQLLPVFIDYGFQPLASPTLRRRLAGAITIDRACRLLHIHAGEFVETLNARLGRPVQGLPVIATSEPAKVGCSCCHERSGR